MPTTMTLIGRANWWLLSWLNRVLPHVDVEGTAFDDADDSGGDHESAVGTGRVPDDQAGASRETEPLMETV